MLRVFSPLIINTEAKGDIYKRQYILFTVMAVYAGSPAREEDSNDQQMR